MSNVQLIKGNTVKSSSSKLFCNYPLYCLFNYALALYSPRELEAARHRRKFPRISANEVRSLKVPFYIGYQGYSER